MAAQAEAVDQAQGIRDNPGRATPGGRWWILRRHKLPTSGILAWPMPRLTTDYDASELSLVVRDPNGGTARSAGLVLTGPLLESSSSDPEMWRSGR